MRKVLAVVAAFLLGMLTSWAQGWLPDAFASFANSVSGWTILTVLVIALARPGLVAGALLGVLCFVALVLGYTAASQLRGLTYDPLFWSVAGVLAGPFVGASAAALVGPSRRTAVLGACLVGVVLVADGLRGLLVLSASTSPVYWLVVIGAGVLLPVVALRERRRTT